MAPEDRGTAEERCWFTSSQRHPEGVELQGGPTAWSLAVGCLGHRGGFRAPHHRQGAREWCVWTEGVSTGEQSTTSRSLTWAGDSRRLPACPWGRWRCRACL